MGLNVQPVIPGRGSWRHKAIAGFSFIAYEAIPLTRIHANTRIKKPQLAMPFIKINMDGNLITKKRTRLSYNFPHVHSTLLLKRLFYFVYTNKEADQSASKNVCVYGYLNTKHRASLLVNFHFTVFTKYCQLWVFTQLNNSRIFKPRNTQPKPRYQFSDSITRKFLRVTDTIN
jgi:hypothetical protein